MNFRAVNIIPQPPPRPEEGHKGTFGTVIVVGGSPTMIGAPAICAHAALRSGVGLVKIATGAKQLAHALTIEPGATGIILEGEAEERLAALEEADPQQRAVLAVGPGLGGSEEAAELVMRLLDGPRAMVLDADGLNALARSGRLVAGRESPLILTPHPGEFQRLAKAAGIGESALDAQDRPLAAGNLARAHHAVVVLKGRGTVICDGEKYFVNRTGNVALATSGMGDVLTGVIAALVAQGTEAFDAAVLGAYVHGLAADRWAERFGPAGLLARELADHLVSAFNDLRADVRAV
jgi:NAD(P)H-hydrate epimerase